MEFTAKDLGLNGEFENKEKALEAFHNKFISRELAIHDKGLVGQIVGRRLGDLTTLTRREFALATGDIQDQPIEEVIKMASKKSRQAIEEIKKAAPEEYESEAIKAMEGKVKEYQDKLEAATGELMEANKTIEEKDRTFNERIKSFRIDGMLNEVRSQVPLVDNMTSVQREGLRVELAKLEWDLDDDEKLIVKRDGELITNSTKTGFLGPKDVFLQIAQENQLLKQNGQGGKPKPEGGGADPKPGAPTVNKKTGKPVHPAVLKWQQEQAARD